MLCLLLWEIWDIFPKFRKILDIFSKTQNISSLWHILPAIWFCVAGTQIIFYYIPGIWGGNHLDSRSQQTAKSNLKPFPFLETFGEHIPCNLSSLQNIITPQLANTVLWLKGYGVFFWPARKKLKAFGQTFDKCLSRERDVLVHEVSQSRSTEMKGRLRCFMLWRMIEHFFTSWDLEIMIKPFPSRNSSDFILL